VVEWLYPKTKKPEWLKVGTKVQILGEGDKWFKVTAIDEPNSRAAVAFEYGELWESFRKLSR